MDKRLVLREATETDAGLILKLIKELACYEKMEELVTGTENDILETIFQKKRANAIIAMWDGEPVGYCIYFYNFSTFLCRDGIYIEDVYIQPQARGNGIGLRIFKLLAQKAIDENCGRLEWICLDWNEPSLEFYKGLGAEQQRQWVRHYMERDAMEKLAARE